jgi:hypothetical protein
MNDYLKQRMLDNEENPAYNTSMKEDSPGTPGPLYIVLSGKKQTGKDTAALMASKMLYEANKTFKITAFAEVLKDTAITVLGLDRDLVYGTNEDKERLTHVLWDTFPFSIRLKYREAWYMPLRSGPMTIRDVLQVMGTDIFRTMFDYNVWANAPFSRDWGDLDVVIISDCRFPNEKTVTEDHSGVIIRLERQTGFKDGHSSETALDGYAFECIYDNEGSLEDLEAFMRDALQKLNLL